MGVLLSSKRFARLNLSAWEPCLRFAMVMPDFLNALLTAEDTVATSMGLNGAFNLRKTLGEYSLGVNISDSQ
jgi:hypothetical protein